MMKLTENNGNNDKWWCWFCGTFANLTWLARTLTKTSVTYTHSKCFRLVLGWRSPQIYPSYCQATSQPVSQPQACQSWRSGGGRLCVQSHHRDYMVSGTPSKSWRHHTRVRHGRRQMNRDVHHEAQLHLFFSVFPAPYYSVFFFFKVTPEWRAEPRSLSSV